MQQTLLMIVIEVLGFALLVLSLLQIMAWRGKMRRQTKLEQLIDEINDKQGLRSDSMMSVLVDRYGLDRNTAKKLSKELFKAEKAFLRQYIEQEIAESVDDFYDNLSALLDNYLTVLPEQKPEPPAETAPAEEASGTVPEKQPEHKPATEVEQAPDWGDVFDD